MDHINNLIPELMKALQSAEKGEAPLTGSLLALKNALRMREDAITISSMERTYADSVANRPPSRPASPKPGTDREADPAPDNGDNNGNGIGVNVVTTVTPSPTLTMAKKKERAPNNEARHRARQSGQLLSAAAGAGPSKAAPPSTRSASSSPIRAPRRVVRIDLNDDNDMDADTDTAAHPAPRLPMDVKVHPARSAYPSPTESSLTTSRRTPTASWGTAAPYTPSAKGWAPRPSPGYSKCSTSTDRMQPRAW